MCKKIIAVFMLISLIFTGCAQAEKETEEIFTLSQSQQEKYTEMIEDTLNSLYWYYDSDSLAYFEGKVPDNNDKNKSIYKASEDSGFDMKAYSGKDAVVYTANLSHFNSEKAGIAYFYFVRNNIAGLYYVPYINRGLCCSLKERNVFCDFEKFEKAENNDIKSKGFEPKSIKVLSDGFDSFYNDEKLSYQLVIEDDRVISYCFNGRVFAVSRRLTCPDGLKPISASYLNNGNIAIIAGIGLEHEDGAEDILSERIASRSILIYRQDGTLLNNIDLTRETYSSICAYKDGFITSNDNSFEIFEKDSEGTWNKVGRYYVGVQANDIKIADIDSNGTDELIATDGNDLYLFEINENNIELWWRTNISVESYYKYIYTADLNGDGIKEIYICDITGTAIRYELKENGLVSNNEDINYGQMIFAADFNIDGKDDYILSDGENIILNLGK